MIEELLSISQENEHWNQVPDFSRYWISDQGRVYCSKLHRLLKQQADYSGYLIVNLHSDSCQLKGKRVHRLVAEAFLPDWRPEWPWTVNHINGKKDDNRLANLEMLTTQDNSKHYQTAECFAQSREDAKRSMIAKMKEKCNDPDYTKKMSDRMKKVWENPDMRAMYIDCLHERHSDPDKRKHLSDKMKEITADSRYRKGMSDRQKKNWEDTEYRKSILAQRQDRIWVHSLDSEKWIHRSELSEYLQKGYVEGRLRKNMKATTEGNILVSDRTHNKFVPREELKSYLDQGWILGRVSDKKRVKCIQTGQVFSNVKECADTFHVSCDLITARCEGIVKMPRKLRGVDFCYLRESENG